MKNKRVVFLAVASAAFLVASQLKGLEAFASDHHMFEDEAAEATSGAMSGWDVSNNPSSWKTIYNYNMNQLPLNGKVAGFQPWSDIYWPTNQAGIAARWNWPGQNGFKYRLYSEAEVRALTPGQRARLSPAEKYDIFMNRFDYPTVSRVRANTTPHAEYWRGICHGWAPAAVHHAEPATVTVTGKNGITIPFGSGDVKGLLDEYYADNAVATSFLGTRCSAGEGGRLRHRIRTLFTRNSAACSDTNAGALHVILANELGIKRQGFVADIDPQREVWNQPVYAFNARLQGSRAPHLGAAPGTVREVLVHADMYYADELEKESWHPVVGTTAFRFGVGKYDYTLELDAAGRIIGGEWISAARPDFLWRTDKLQFAGYMAGLNQIYRPAPSGR